MCGGDFPHGPSQSGSKRESALVERPANHPRTSASPTSTNIPPPIGPMIATRPHGPRLTEDGGPHRDPSLSPSAGCA